MSGEEKAFNLLDDIITELKLELNEKTEHNTALLKQVQELQDKQMKYSKEESQVLFKVQQVKTELNELKLKKTGHNSYQKYNYYELEDINKPIAETLLKHGLSSLFTFKEDMAYLQIIDRDTGAWIQWQTPLKTSERWRKTLTNTTKKGDVGDYMKPIQALQTYARRALYLQALEIAEPNTIEQEGQNNKKGSNRSEGLQIPEGIDPSLKDIFDKIKQDFGDKVEYNQRTIKNKLSSMKRSGKIDTAIYNNCLEIVEKM